MIGHRTAKTMADDFDLIVIGAGTAGRACAQAASEEYAARVVLVEETRWGGSCPNVACNPTKAYLASAELVHDINTKARLLGIDVAPASVDLQRVKSRKDSLLKPQENWLADLTSAYETVEGRATFVDPRTVRVGDRELHGERVLIATGSRTAIPPIDGLEGIDWVDHVTALELTELPESLLVVGGGPTGLEFAQAFSRFGSRVTIVEPEEHVAGKSDPDAANELAQALVDEGIDVITGTAVSSVRRTAETIVATLSADRDRDDRELHVQRVFLATGRNPNVEALALEGIGVRQTESGTIVVDERMRTNVEGIWAAGDVVGVASTPISQYQGRIAAADMFGDDSRRADYSAVLNVIFTDPELASVGLSEQAAADQALTVDTAIHSVAKQTRARFHDTNRGLIKLVFERDSRRVLGLHVVSRNASDVIAGFAVAMNLGVTVDDIARAHHAYPTFGEGVKGAAEAAAQRRAVAA